MYRASPIIHVSDFDKAAVAAVEVFETDFQTTDFVSLGTSYVRAHDGKTTATYALVPNWSQYPRGRMSFGSVSVTGAPTAATLELVGLLADDNVVVLGTSTYADGTFPVIEFDVAAMKYYVRLSVLTGGTTPAVTVTTFIQGYFPVTEPSS